jgi:putative Mn2+ efflux pump MntP
MTMVGNILAAGLLAAIGLRMMWESRKPDETHDHYDPTKGWILVALSLATSIDALAAGISLGLVGSPIFKPALIIGLVTMLLTYSGIRIGKNAGDLMGPRAEMIGGLVLICIGARILLV